MHANATSADAPTRRSARSLFLMAAPPVAFFVLAIVAAAAMLWGNAAGENGGPVGHMRDMAGELTANIRDLASNGLAKTKAIALDERLPSVIAAGDRKAAELLANDLLKGSLELDIVAIFDEEGSLLAVNTAGRDGAPLPPGAVDKLYHADFSQRGVVQGCLSDHTTTARMEFQTQCDFTPPIFNSSGLSVAFSAPVPGEQPGSRAGVVSTRLNFDRVSDLLRENSFVRAGNSIYLVSDSGRFFDEEINSGRVPHPLTGDQVNATLRAEGSSASGAILVHRDNMVLMGQRVEATSAVDGGGINVLLRASQAWVEGEANRSRRLAGGAALGALFAAGVWCLYLAARNKQHRAQASLLAERARTALILENVGECVLSTDPQGRIGFANGAAVQMLGLDPAAAIGRDLRDFFAGGTPIALDKAWRAEQTTLRRDDGSTFQARVTCTILPDRAGAVLALCDLTDKLETDRLLLEATRQAGMAQVATGVLHNVGNVLNSVNISASMVASKLKQSEIPNLVLASDMMSEHRSDLPTYLTGDERGRHLPDFLIECARTLGDEQKSMLAELDAVTKGIEHVKHVVSLQQEHAKKPTVGETIKATEIMEAAIQLQLDSLKRHGVTVERKFEQVPPAVTDKHLVLQILINLIANAGQAMQEIDKGSRTLTLAVRQGTREGTPALVFEVADRGVGIPAENLRRIFGQGFTTKASGHGFGLHSAANAAAQMGGSLEAFSDGPGKGARFVLTVPVNKAASTRVPATEVPALAA